MARQHTPGQLQSHTSQGQAALLLACSIGASSCSIALQKWHAASRELGP